ncbi:hypothetical protein [uncultured Microscilla sp.]|uniref:hypothetical protein n=1 Tax=uncultured Microscilla sp. TaxID=432653 RepID=UPI0026281619|nr:hypothetical protein [uncultured Microscilla sp.]
MTDPAPIDKNAIDRFKQLLFSTDDERNVLLALEIAKAHSFQYVGLKDDLFEVWKQAHVSGEVLKQIEQIIDLKYPFKRFRSVVQQALQEEHKIAWEVGNLALGLLRDCLDEDQMQHLVDKYQHEKRRRFSTHEPLSGVELIYLHWLDKLGNASATHLPKTLKNIEKLIRK